MKTDQPTGVPSERKIMKPTDQTRLGELMGKMEAATNDGDLQTLTQDDIGDIYKWLVWIMDNKLFTDAGETYFSGVHSNETPLCECGQPKNSIRHSSATAKSVDSHAFKPVKS